MAKLKKPVVQFRKVPGAPPERAAAFVVPPAPVEAPKGGDKRVVTLRNGASMRRVNMLFPLDLARRLRRYCADHDRNLTQASVAALDAYLRAQGY
jgi:hypothetical protein